MKKFKTIILLGPSGSGKDTLVSILQEGDYKTIFNYVVPTTTRPPRRGEQNGKEYYFTNHFENVIGFSEFNNWKYGYSIDNFDINKINIVIANPKNLELLLSTEELDVIKTFLLYVNPKERLIRQLEREDDPNINEIFRRYSSDIDDFGKIPDELYSELVNETLEDLNKNVSIITSTVWAYLLKAF